jgi:quercetin 2,3-dioxygenase
MSSTLPGRVPVTELPGTVKPYVLEFGDGRSHLLIDQVGRCVAGAEETDGAWSVMVLDGPKGGPIPLHYHDGEDEFFLCTRGRVQVWADEASRILSPGDFAYVPRGTVHAYRCHEHYSGFFGPIVPGGWDRFFDLTGEPYAGPTYPVGHEIRVPFEKFGRAEQEFSMKYLPERAYAEASTAPDDALPDEQRPYFLKAGEGPRSVLGGALQTVLCGAAQTDGKITMTTIESGKSSRFPAHAHERTTEGLYVMDGRLRVWLDGEEHLLTGGDYASIPPGTEHAWASEAHYTKFVAQSTPGGLEALFASAGEETPHHMFPRDAEAFDVDRLAEAAKGLDVAFTGR